MARRRRGSNEEAPKDNLAAALARWDNAQAWMRKEPENPEQDDSTSQAPAPQTPTAQQPPQQPNQPGWPQYPPPGSASQSEWQQQVGPGMAQSGQSQPPPMQQGQPGSQNPAGPPGHQNPPTSNPQHAGFWTPDLEQPASQPTQSASQAAPPPTPVQPAEPVTSTAPGWEAPQAPAPPIAESWDALLAGTSAMSYPGSTNGPAVPDETGVVDAEFTVDDELPASDGINPLTANGGPSAAPENTVHQPTSYASTQSVSQPAGKADNMPLPPDGSAQVNAESSERSSEDNNADVQQQKSDAADEALTVEAEQSNDATLTNALEPESPAENPANPDNPVWSPSEAEASATDEPDIADLMPPPAPAPESASQPEAHLKQSTGDTQVPGQFDEVWAPPASGPAQQPYPPQPASSDAAGYYPPPPPQQQFYGWAPPAAPPQDYYPPQQPPNPQNYPGQPGYFQPPVAENPLAPQAQPAPAPQPSQAPQPAEPPASQPSSPPGVDELTSQALLRNRHRQPQGGWRKAVYTLSGHTVNPGDSPAELERRTLMQRAMVPVQGCYRIAVISLKGGVGKTTMTVCLGATLASLRGDRVIAVDANPDRGTLSGKIPLETVATVRNLLNDANDIGKYSDVRRYTSQSPDRLEVLASESDPAVSIAFSEDDYRVVAGILERFYNVVLTDCGTGLLHSAMSGVLALANQLIVVSSGSVDGARSASATLDWLDAHGHSSLVAGSVAVINSVRPKSGGVDLDRLDEHFASRCRAVSRIPYDPHLEEGAEVDLAELKEPTRLALLGLAAQVADGFPVRSDARRGPINQSLGGLA